MSEKTMQLYMDRLSQTLRVNPENTWDAETLMAVASVRLEL